jgi:hypothetical protein
MELETEPVSSMAIAQLIAVEACNFRNRIENLSSKESD